ncbi:hypothetical protein CkaCkLH20_10664 [Colletotrichum karsti]|uniref:Major facilitator superfamily (MFS) profile domain-containing protein n=1 Tax=Colletotrichum karsti TaxID=1095194 RepID=A0A9P6HX50_9PEZI|nr:uncharacterized protein CkaCkLH20_10664 [Colletotrichum karsti]KAF9871730.1 hypothetical protein CkaCkLH20_10664 [Colletotrichum karsti]
MADTIEQRSPQRPVEDLECLPDLKMGGNADEGYDILEGSDFRPITPEQSAAICKKLDRRLLPLMCVLYGICYIDKLSMSWAVLFHFREDLNLKGTEYSWASSMFYFGFLVAQYPGNYLLQKLKVSRFLGMTVLAWGVLMVGHLGLKEFKGLLVIRFLLGVVESVVMPGFVLYTSTFYTRKEQVWRTLLWSAMQGIFTIFGALASYGLGHITNTVLRPWMYIFLILGILSFLTGSIWLVIMPETPGTASFFTEEEKRIAVQRVAENMTGIKSYGWKTYQIWHALKDPKLWLLLGFEFFKSVPNGGLTNFGSLVVAGFGFDSFKTLLIGLPSSLVSAGSMILWGFFSIKYGNLRTWGMIVPMVIAIAGVAAVYATLGTDANIYGRAVAYWLINSYAVTSPFALTIVGQNIAGHTKRAVANTLLFIMYAAGNIAGPFFFRSEDAPRYVLAIVSIMVCLGIGLLCAVLLRFYMIWENKRRDRLYGRPENLEDRLDGMRMGMHDKTDDENKDFRYNPSDVANGELTIIVGLGVQLAFFGCFLVVSGVFHRRMRHAPTAKSEKPYIQ